MRVGFDVMSVVIAGCERTNFERQWLPAVILHYPDPIALSIGKVEQISYSFDAVFRHDDSPAVRYDGLLGGLRILNPDRANIAAGGVASRAAGLPYVAGDRRHAGVDQIVIGRTPRRNL